VRVLKVQRHANLGLLGEGKRFPGSDLRGGGAGTGKTIMGSARRPMRMATRSADPSGNGDATRPRRHDRGFPSRGMSVAPIGHVFLLN